MKVRSILLLVLVMIQDQTLAANKHLVESKGKQYLVKTQGRTEKGKGAERVSSSNIYLGLNSAYMTHFLFVSQR